MGWLLRRILGISLDPKPQTLNPIPQTLYPSSSWRKGPTKKNPIPYTLNPIVGDIKGEYQEFSLRRCEEEAPEVSSAQWASLLSATASKACRRMAIGFRV